MQMVLFSWLITIVLGEAPDRVGAAQTVSMLPGLLLTLYGGAVADRHDGRRLLVLVHALSVIPHLVLAAAIVSGRLSYAGVVAYAMGLGALGAFTMPTRDSLLSRVSGPNLQRAVSAAMAVQNLFQLGGIALGGAAVYLGAPLLLVASAVLMAAGGVATLRLAPAPPALRLGADRGTAHEILEGLREVLRSPRLAPPTVLALGIGLFFVGSFSVALPLLVRDVYGGSSPEIAALQASLMTGMLLAIVGLLVVGGVRRPGRALLVGLGLGSVVLAAVSLGPPLYGLYALIFLWGMCGGVGMTASRSLVQEAARPSHRARVLSVYQLGFAATAPLGALAMGLLIERVGALHSLVYPSAGMLAAVLATALRSDLWSLELSATDRPDAGAARRAR
ncbi:MAG: MFS transporter [Myxococcota bacterium]